MRLLLLLTCRRSTFVTATAFVLAATSAQAALLYEVVELPLPTGAVSIAPSGINNFGQVVGTVTYAASSSGFLYVGGNYSILNAPVDHVF